MKAYLRNIELAPKQLASQFILICSIVGPTLPNPNAAVVVEISEISGTLSPVEGFPDSCYGWGDGGETGWRLDFFCT